MIALALYRDGLCPLHGGPRSECEKDGDAFPDFTADSTYCFASVALIEAQQAGSDPARPNKFAAAKLWRVHKRR